MSKLSDVVVVTSDGRDYVVFDSIYHTEFHRILGELRPEEAKGLHSRTEQPEQDDSLYSAARKGRFHVAKKKDEISFEVGKVESNRLDLVALLRAYPENPNGSPEERVASILAEHPEVGERYSTTSQRFFDVAYYYSQSSFFTHSFTDQRVYAYRPPRPKVLGNPLER